MENPFKKTVEDNTDEIKEQVSQEETETNVAEENATTEAEEKITENPLQAKYDELNNQYLRLAADCDKVKECFNLAYKNFTDVMAKIGLETIPAEGQEFDPNLHEAVMQTPTDEKPEHTIINELQKGYKLGDKVLRASLVNVATAP